MKKPLIIALCVLMAITCVFSGVCAGAFAERDEASGVKATFDEPTATKDEAIAAATEDEAEATVVPIHMESGKAQVLKLSEADEELLTAWKSSDDSIVTVDDGGRIDAVKEGSAQVTASFSDNSKLVYEITVVQAERQKSLDTFSTAITANEDIVSKNKTDGGRDLYRILVNKTCNVVTVYTYDSEGNYTVPVRAMICSCGKDGSTVTGEFNIYFKAEWHALYNNVYGQYVSGISGDYLFHSVPYTDLSSSTLEVDEYNKLGTEASLGCVRLSVADTKWIYDNCPVGTYVKIYESDKDEPLGKPEAIRLADLQIEWDPTDKEEGNPYHSKKPGFTGAEDCQIELGGSFSPTDAVKAYDTGGSDITDKIEIVGNVVTTRRGKYKLTYSVTDALHRTAVKDVWITVE